LLKKKDDLGERAEAIAQSVLLCLTSDCKDEDLRTYLREAEVLAVKRLESLESLLESVTVVS
jgi:hypothetical protein